MSFLLNEDFFNTLTTISPSTSPSDISPFASWLTQEEPKCKLPCKNNKCGWKCACPLQTTTDKSTQTGDSVEFLLGELILRHCPQPYLVKNYVKHINTSPKLVQLLTKDIQQDSQSRNKQSRLDE